MPRRPDWVRLLDGLNGLRFLIAADDVQSKELDFCADFGDDSLVRPGFGVLMLDSLEVPVLALGMRTSCDKVPS